MPGRSHTPDGYRFGFNGQEQDNDIKGDGNALTAMNWEYDPRLGRRWNKDDYVFKPWQSPSACFDNNPIFKSDPNGDVPGANDKKGGVGDFFVRQIAMFFVEVEFVLRSFGLTDKNLDAVRQSEAYKKDPNLRGEVFLESLNSGLKNIIYIETSSRAFENILSLSSQKMAKLDLPKQSIYEEGNAIIINAEKSGAAFLTADAEGEKYLNSMGADASFMAQGDAKSSILLRPNASRAAILEESIHHGQLLKYGEKYMSTNRMQLEIEAQDELLRIGKKEGWDKSEINRITEAKKTYQKEVNKSNSVSSTKKQ